MKNKVIMAFTLILLVCVFAASACSVAGIEVPEFPGAPKATEEPAVEPTAELEPTPTPDPETEECKVGSVAVKVKALELMRGDRLELVREEGDDWFACEKEGTEYLVYKNLVRLPNETAPEEKDGYSDKETKVYATADFTREPIAELSRNTEIHLIDMLCGKAYISWTELNENNPDAPGQKQFGYIEASKFSEDYFSSGGWGGGDWGGGGGYSGGGGGADGGSIALSSASRVIYAEAISSETDGSREDYVFTPGTGTVFADGTELYITILHRNDIVKVAEHNKDESRILINHVLYTIPSSALRFGNVLYESWEGYTQPDAVGYQFSDKSDSGEGYETNTAVTVLEEEGNLYIISVEGRFAYVDKDFVSEEEYHHSSGGGYWGGGGGGYSGGGGGGGGGWTPPAM